MHTRLTMMQAQFGKRDAVLKIFRDSIIPATKTQKGFRQIDLFTKSNSDQIVLLSFWATEKDLKSVDASGFFKEQIALINDLLTGPPMTDMYDVAAEDKAPRWQFIRKSSRSSKADDEKPERLH